MSHSCRHFPCTLPRLLLLLQKPHPAAQSVLHCPPLYKKTTPNLELQNVVLQLALEVQEVGDGQLAPQVSPEEVGGERRVEAGFEGVPGGGAVPVAHAHAGLGTDDALHLKTTGRMSQSKPHQPSTSMKYSTLRCVILLSFLPKTILKRHNNSEIWLNLRESKNDSGWK